jgi:hypothetical protein
VNPWWETSRVPGHHIGAPRRECPSIGVNAGAYPPSCATRYSQHVNPCPQLPAPPDCSPITHAVPSGTHRPPFPIVPHRGTQQICPLVQTLLVTAVCVDRHAMPGVHQPYAGVAPPLEQNDVPASLPESSEPDPESTPGCGRGSRIPVLDELHPNPPATASTAKAIGLPCRMTPA